MVRSVAVLVVLLAAAGLAAQSPEIDVRREATGIPNNTVHNIGSVTVGQAGNFVLSIDNTGAGTLTLGSSDSVTISGVSGCTAVVTAQPQTTVAPTTGTTNFMIQVQASVSGAFNFTVEIANDDPDEAPYTVIVIGAACDCEEEELEFEDDDEDGEGGEFGCVAHAGGLPFGLILLGLAAFRRRK